MNPLPIVTAVDGTGDPTQRIQFGGISEELLDISLRLKEGLENLSAWVQMHALLLGEGPSHFEPAARELNRVRAHFSLAYSDLLSYPGQFPEPFDAHVAHQMEETIQKCFWGELKEATACQIEGYSSSWSELVCPSEGAEWSADLVQAVCGAISAESWRRARTCLAALRVQLP